MTEWTDILAMKNSNIGYLIREGMRGVFLHGFMSFAAVCVTVACLIIIGSFSLILYNVNSMVRDLEQENEVLIYIDETYSEAEAKSVPCVMNNWANFRGGEFVSTTILNANSFAKLVGR